MRRSVMPLGAFVVAILVLVPLPSQWRARNTATLSLILWLFVLNMLYGINAVVWAGNAEVRAPLWCDISTKLTIGVFTALPAVTLCVCIDLESAAAGRSTRRSACRRSLNAVLCLGMPVLLMLLHSIVQGHRFNIVEDVGCQPATYASLPTLFIVWLPPLVLSLLTIIYAVAALHHCWTNRLSFASRLQILDSDVSPGTYLRLLTMCTTIVGLVASATIYAVQVNVSTGLHPWTSWAEVHSNWFHIDTYTTGELSSPASRNMLLAWWSIPASAVIVFACLSFGQESREIYCYLWEELTQLVRKSRRGQGRDNIWPDVNGGTRRIVIHKFSTVEFVKDADLVIPVNVPSQSKLCGSLSSEFAQIRATVRTVTPPLAACPRTPRSCQSACTLHQGCSSNVKYDPTPPMPAWCPV